MFMAHVGPMTMSHGGGGITMANMGARTMAHVGAMTMARVGGMPMAHVRGMIICPSNYPPRSGLAYVRKPSAGEVDGTAPSAVD
eukprot:jgi/Botrbrau1/10110/Bobra.20_2s0017.1